MHTFLSILFNEPIISILHAYHRRKLVGLLSWGLIISIGLEDMIWHFVIIQTVRLAPYKCSYLLTFYEPDLLPDAIKYRNSSTQIQVYDELSNLDNIHSIEIQTCSSFWVDNVQTFPFLGSQTSSREATW